jgi:hypothetical protein
MQLNPDFLKKVLPILKSAGITQSSQLFNENGQIDFEKVIAISSKITEKLYPEDNVEETKSEDFPSLLPTAIKVSSKYVSNEILGFASEEEINEVKTRIQSENRDGKIESVIEGGEFVEKKLEDDPQYKELMKKGVMPLSAPSANLFYLDYKYTHKKTRRAGKKHKKKNE